MKRTARTQAQLALAKQFLNRYQPVSSHPVMERGRAEARELLAAKGLPIYRQEDYQSFKIDSWLSQEWQQVHPSPLSPAEAKEYACRFTYPDVEQAFLIEGRAISSIAGQGYFAGPISQFVEQYPGVAEAYYGTMPSLREAPLSLLNTLYAEDLFVYYIPQGTKLKRPIHLIHYATTGSTPHALTFPRILVIAEPDSEATLLLCDHADRLHQSAYIGVMELYVGEGTKLSYYNIEESSPQTLRLMDTHIQQKEDSEVVVDNVTVQNGETRNNFYCDLIGERASVDLDGLGILDDEKRLDNWTLVRHSSPSCHSDQLFKYTMNDTSVGSFSGRIYVAPDAQKTEAYQNNRNLLLSSTAKMVSKPQLEIYADDVKCSHGMTTGELNDQALFYMQQRGIPLMEARHMLIAAFMNDVLEKISYSPLRERLTTTIDHRYRGIPSTCQ